MVPATPFTITRLTPLRLPEPLALPCFLFHKQHPKHFAYFPIKFADSRICIDRIERVT